ncbi:hypothetical protein BDN72DRAFT_917560 [Pluteus cervinus]|uniref:Uncharacterized protein n=1 Tax=Pluteus cervinus TaxID=181527 RepID=A0ACD3AMF5_9AGAR|nr:hypothetical protein BDN72DRAFT_917560 [Pluteus cervinus]
MNNHTDERDVGRPRYFTRFPERLLPPLDLTLRPVSPSWSQQTTQPAVPAVTHLLHELDLNQPTAHDFTWQASQANEHRLIDAVISQGDCGPCPQVPQKGIRADGSGCHTNPMESGEPAQQPIWDPFAGRPQNINEYQHNPPGVPNISGHSPCATNSSDTARPQVTGHRGTQTGEPHIPIRKCRFPASFGERVFYRPRHGDREGEEDNMVDEARYSANEGNGYDYPLRSVTTMWERFHIRENGNNHRRKHQDEGFFRVPSGPSSEPSLTAQVSVSNETRQRTETTLGHPPEFDSTPMDDETLDYEQHESPEDRKTKRKREDDDLELTQYELDMATKRARVRKAKFNYTWRG